MSAAETAIDNMAKGQALARSAPTGTEVCPEGCVRIGVFFDGTNNSMYRDRATDDMNPPEDANAISNVVKLYDVYQRFTCVNQPTQPSASFGCNCRNHAATPHGIRRTPKGGYIVRALSTPPLPVTHLKVGYSQRNGRSAKHP